MIASFHKKIQHIEEQSEILSKSGERNDHFARKIVVNTVHAY